MPHVLQCTLNWIVYAIGSYFETPVVFQWPGYTIWPPAASYRTNASLKKTMRTLLFHVNNKCIFKNQTIWIYHGKHQKQRHGVVLQTTTYAEFWVPNIPTVEIHLFPTNLDTYDRQYSKSFLIALQNRYHINWKISEIPNSVTTKRKPLWHGCQTQLPSTSMPLFCTWIRY